MNSAPKVSEKQIVVNNFPDGVLQNSPFPTKDGPRLIAHTSDSTVGRPKFNDFDLNTVYSNSEDCEGLESLQHHVNVGNGSLGIPLWQQKDSHQSSPPQTSANSNSLSGQSPSSSGGDAQSRTDRIVFKLFGKDPNHFPDGGLRSQILNWLSHSPTDIESYIRPGCIILTVYLRLAESTWQELQDDLSSSLRRLLAVSDDAFWRTGWVYTRVQHHIAFIYNGQIVLDAALPLTSHNHARIGSVTPIAVSVSEKVQFLVKGYNLSRHTARLLCALEGKYLPQEATSDLFDSEHKEIQCLTFPCSVPDITGRGFLEVEDHGLSGDFFPFIVAEQDVCLEIRTLESAVEASEFSDSLISSDKMGMKNQVLNFIHEMGWLLRRSSLRSRISHSDPNSEIFPLTRFRWLMEFSMDHDWCAVVKKLLDVLFDGNVGSGEYPSVELAVLDMGLLHKAVRRRCRQMVELLLRYVPKQPIKKGCDRVLFRPDAVGPGGGSQSMEDSS
ncbi:hypothetical protein AQUCO_02900064v1 [Aquilegia coerulea]|uniref:Uncharacterized protein n=1 Tax=Aquilegia coerulea TaxID=218851 RepID=A0A2G5D416_AQUCA|nr:hypothetical protein AQUCO_02900064v1 [Aquilegia coerulea]